MAGDEIKPQPHPSLNLPQSHSTVELSIINTTTDLVCPAERLLEPVQKGHEFMNLPTFAFLVENKNLGKTIMFDLGCRKDWWNHSPATYAAIKEGIPGINIPKNVNEIQREGDVDDRKIDAVVWSHWHFDHTGDLSLFPQSTDLYVGPGFSEAFMPGYPTNKDCPILDADFKGRTVHEPSFDTNTKIGAFPSHDFFGDGSFYLLDVPGHAVGHISGFARTTPDTFVFMGGDICHFGGSYRPSAYAPMPGTIPSSVPLDRHIPTPCPCSFFQGSHPDPKNLRTSPFYNVTREPGGWYVDPPTAQKSVKSLEAFDADENVFVCVAHDGGLLPVVDFFPNGTMTDWKKKGWKERSKWGFLNELPIDGKPPKPWIAPGRVKEGKVLSQEDL